MDPRLQAAELLRYAGDRKVTDPVFVAVTEGRYAVQELARRRNPAIEPYSSCGDAAHWLLYRMGVRFPWVNRRENAGWRVSWNVTLLAPMAFYGANVFARRAQRTDQYAAGDILIVNAAKKSSHVICVIEHDPATGTLHTCEYGQPHGALKIDRIVNGMIGLRTLDVFLPLYDVLNAAAAAPGMLCEPETVAEYSAKVEVH